MVGPDLSQTGNFEDLFAAAQARAAATPNPVYPLYVQPHPLSPLQVSRSSHSAEREQRLESVAAWR